jgi:hypothetical protein
MMGNHKKYKVTNSMGIENWVTRWANSVMAKPLDGKGDEQIFFIWFNTEAEAEEAGIKIGTVFDDEGNICRETKKRGT